MNSQALTGDMLIGAAAVRGTAGTQRAFNPATNAEIAEPVFGLGQRADVDRAAALAQAAFDPTARCHWPRAQPSSRRLPRTSWRWAMR